jgi:hypothetical protein
MVDVVHDGNMMEMSRKYYCVAMVGFSAADVSILQRYDIISIEDEPKVVPDETSFSRIETSMRLRAFKSFPPRHLRPP